MAGTAAGGRAEHGCAHDPLVYGRGDVAEPAGPHKYDEDGGSWPHQQQPGRPSTPPTQTPEQQQMMLAMAQQQWLFMQQQQHMQQLQQQQQDKQHGAVPGTTTPPYPYAMPPMGGSPGGVPQLPPQQMAAMMPYPTQMTQQLAQQMPYMYPGMWGMVTPPASPPDSSFAASSSQSSPGMGASPQQLMDGMDGRRAVQISDVTDVDERSLPQKAASWYLSNLSFVASAYLGMWLYFLGLAMFLADICYRLATRHARLAIRAAAAVSAVQEDPSGSSSVRESLVPLLEMPAELREGESERAAQSVARALALHQGANGTAHSTELTWLSPQQWQQRQQQQGQQQRQRQQQQEDDRDQDVLPWPYHELSDSLAVMTGLWFGVWLRVVRTMGWQLPLSAARSVGLVALAQLRTAAYVAFLVARATYALAMTTYVSVPTRDLAPAISYAARAVDTGRRAASAALGFVSRTADRFHADASSSSGGSSAGRLTLEPRAVVGAAAAALQYVLATLLKVLERAVSALVGLRRRVLDSGVQVVPLAALLANAGARAAAMAGATAGAVVGFAEAGATWAIEALSHGAPTVARQMLVTYLSFLFAMVRRLGEESARLLGQLVALMWEHGGNGLLSATAK